MRIIIVEENKKGLISIPSPVCVDMLWRKAGVLLALRTVPPRSAEDNAAGIGL